MISVDSSTPPGGKFVRRCCAFYICALIVFWTFSTEDKYVRARLRNEAFPLKVSSIMFKRCTYIFTDFLDFDPVTERLIGRGSDDKAYELVIVYPAPMMCVYILFTRVFAEPLRAYLEFIVLSVVLGAACLILALSSSSANRLLLAGVVGVSAVLSYPLLTVLERANMEGFLWVVVALGLTAFVARHHKTAAVLFGLAASMKMFPGILLLLLLARKRYKELAIAAVAFVLFTAIALHLLGPSIPVAIAEVRSGLGRVGGSHLMSYRPPEVGYDHSLFSVLKQVLYLLHSHDKDDVALNSSIQAAALPYLLFVLPGFAALYWFRIRRLPILNQAMALVILAVTLPYVSGEYTLNHVYFAWALFLLFLARDVTAGRESIPWPAAKAMLSSCAFVFALGPFGRYAGQLKTCALMVLLLTALMTPMHSSLLDDEIRPAAEGAGV